MKNGHTTVTKEEIRLASLPEKELKMREVAAMVSTIVTQVAAKVAPGVTLNELDIEADKWVKQLGVEAFNLGYKPAWAKTPYPAILCLSVNDTIAHGIPNDYVLKEGDTICIDTGIKFNGVCGDCAITLPVGRELHKNHERLLKAAKGACYAGIAVIKDGVAITEIAAAVQQYAKNAGFVTNTTLSGHGIGESMHEENITIPFFTSHDSRYWQMFGGKKLKAGDVVCIEPMLTKYDKFGKLEADGWTLTTRDGKRSAMFEHMVLVTTRGAEILTDHFTK